MIDDAEPLYLKHKTTTLEEHHTCNSNPGGYRAITEAAVDYVFFIALSHCVALLSLTYQMIHSVLWIFCTINHLNIMLYVLLVDPHL